MATYIMLSTLTDEGRKTLKERPDRLKAVNKEVESMGARVVSQFAVLGGYDFVQIFTPASFFVAFPTQPKFAYSLPIPNVAALAGITTAGPTGC